MALPACWFKQTKVLHSNYSIITPVLECTAPEKVLWPWKVWIWDESVVSLDAVAGVRMRRRGAGGRRGFSWRRNQCWLLVYCDLLLLLSLVCMSLFKNGCCEAVFDRRIHNGQAVNRVFGFLKGALQFMAGTLRRYIKKCTYLSSRRKKNAI